MMNNILEQLKPNALPDPVSIWPLAIGWWISLILVILTIIFFSVTIMKYKKKRRYRNSGSYLLKQHYQQYLCNKNSKAFITQCNQLLKRTAIQAFPNESIAQLSGTAWQTFLTQKSDLLNFSNEIGASLGENIYKKHQDVNIEQLYTLTLTWIKKHHA